jgi:hypothetical protein
VIFVGANANSGEDMIQIENVSRRGFLKGIVGTSAFVRARATSQVAGRRRTVGRGFDGGGGSAAQKCPAIATDGAVFIVAHRAETVAATALVCLYDRGRRA